MKCSCFNKDKGPGHILVILSVITLVLAAVVSLFEVELYLAGTQWILVSILLAIYANIFFAGINNCQCEDDK
jgi:membrane protein implicated in regulation of membrane protease activity